MKPHFGQSDAVMNKLAGCNILPNNNRPADLLKLAGYTKAEHEEAAGMPLEDAFMKQPPYSCVPCKHYEVSLDHGPCVSCRDHAKFEEKDFDPVKERDAAYDLGFKDAQGYYGHHNGCDCAVCEDMHDTELRRKIVDAEWNKLLDDNKRLTVLLDAEQKNVVYAQQKWAEAEDRVEKWKAFYDSAVEGYAKQVEELTDRMGADVQFWKDETRRAIEAGDSSYVKAMKLYGATVELVEKYRAALHIIAHMGISGMSWQHDYEKCVNIAKEALEI